VKTAGPHPIKKIPGSRLRLRVSSAAETSIRSGHPWVFANSVREQNREGALGELAVIYDRRDRFLAVGFFDPSSPIRIRILHSGKPETIDRAWWDAHLDRTITRRDGLFDSETTGYRWIHGESDGWPGLVLDRYDRTLVLKIYTAAWLTRLDEIVSTISERLPNERIVLRLSRNIQKLAQSEFKLRDGKIISGASLTDGVVFLESGLKFEADVLRGQKTGFFLDQRENRRIVESLARDRRVLNAFSFSGGFSLYAARGGARSVTDLDISEHALAGSERNFKLNSDSKKIAGCAHRTIQADAFEWMEKRESEKFDLIILDPPSLAKREVERKRALQAYAKLAEEAIRRLHPGGILIAASCSAHVTADEFFALMRETAARSKKQWTEMRTTRHPPDHPATFSEAEYLKCIYLNFA
jgi:23S rRNA (cytosine1962-C5)-methyltransferase